MFRLVSMAIIHKGVVSNYITLYPS